MSDTPTSPLPVPTRALWNWNTAVSGVAPTINTFSSGAKTKTGLQPNDLRSYVQVPLQQWGPSPSL